MDAFYSVVLCRGMKTTSFAERIKAAMTERGIGVNQLDRAIGASQGYTCNLLRRDSKPRADFVVKIASALGVRIEYLLNGEGPMMDPSTTPVTASARQSRHPRFRSSASDATACIDPYPSREIVVALGRAQGVPDSAIAALQTERRDGDDPGEDYWLERLAKHVASAKRLAELINAPVK